MATGAVAVEMEAGPLALWAVKRSLPFIHLRVVLDPLVSPLPSMQLSTAEHGHVSSRAFLRYVLVHFRDWPTLFKLVKKARVAGRVMTNVMATLTQSGNLLDPRCGR